MDSRAREFTLYSRSYCHLCDDMAEALRPLREAFGFGLRVVDVDSDPALEERYGEKVPVLMHENRELCHYFLDAAAVRTYLEACTGTAQGAPSC